MTASHATRSLAGIVGANIKAARDSVGMTQHALGVAIDAKDPMLVSRWERAVHLPSGPNLAALAHLFNVEPGWFYIDHSKAAA